MTYASGRAPSLVVLRIHRWFLTGEIVKGYPVPLFRVVGFLLEMMLWCKAREEGTLCIFSPRD